MLEYNGFKIGFHKGPLVVAGDIVGSDVYGPLQVPVNTNFEHMGVMENPRKNALQLSSLTTPNSYDGM